MDEGIRTIVTNIFDDMKSTKLKTFPLELKSQTDK